MYSCSSYILATSPIISPFVPWAASTHSDIADNCGIPTPVFKRLVHALPGPIPTFTICTQLILLLFHVLPHFGVV